MAEPSAERVVAELLPKLRSAQITYFPIRHHSPACAAHLQRWILAHRPGAVLVEGPESFTALIELLTDGRCICPVALYTNFIDKIDRLHKESPFGPPRFAAFYPFCDYSPELVALRTGRAVGARLRFIDLEYTEMILARQGSPPGAEPEGLRVESLAADPHLLHSEYVQALARRLGCRDFNEVWDHLFEAHADDADTNAFIDRVATYCAMARLDYPPETLERDGTLAREACMAAAIRAELRREDRQGPVLVVTGGFHTVALPDLVARESDRPQRVSLGEGEAGTWLMRYGFEQLDALAGYASGMPSPAFYDRLWHLSPTERARAAADLIVEIGRLARARNLPTALTTPDAIAAVQMAKQLAAMRGHAWPLREDVLDGIRACFVKGEMNGEGQLLMRLVYQELAGNRVGQAPPGAGVPPIVDDFYREARRHRLPVDTTERKKLDLDLYRSAGQREVSRLLHRLDLLRVPFAAFQGGPAFLQGRALDLMHEVWQVGWTPATESALIEASIFGPTVAEAAAARLQQDIARLQEAGEGRNTAAAVGLLVRACRLGLHEQAGAMVPLIDIHIAEDPSFPSVVAGLSQLDLLAHAREPLEAGHLTALPQLTLAAYQRACRLMGEVATCPDAAVDEVLGALRTLREVRAGTESLDAELFHQALRGIVGTAPETAQAAAVGAAAGILYGEGKMTEEELIRVARGYLGGSVRDVRKSCGILRGLLATAREIAWQVTEVIRALDAQFQAWDETTFLEALPELRLAFTDLTPREIARVADHVAGLHGEQSLGELVHADLDESEVRFALEITRVVRDSLRADGLITTEQASRGNNQ